MNWKRLAPLTGVVFVVLLVVSFIVGGDTPDFDDSAQDVVSFYSSHEGSQITSAILGAYAVLFFVFFAGTLRGALRRSEEPPGILSAVAFGGALLVAFGGLIFAGLTFTLADIADESTIDPVAIQTLNVLSGEFFIPLAVGVGVFQIAAGIAIVRGRALPAWLGWVGIVIGIAAVTPVGFFAFLVMLAWVLVASVAMYLQGREASAPPPPTAPSVPPA
jgi:hypothetical protein